MLIECLLLRFEPGDPPSALFHVIGFRVYALGFRASQNKIVVA